MLRAIPRIKEALQVNIELASPADFIPLPPGWEERSPPVARIGRVSFHHIDPPSFRRAVDTAFPLDPG